MTKFNKSLFVSYRLIDNGCIAAVPLDYIQKGIVTKDKELQVLARIYKDYIFILREMLGKMELKKSKKIALPSLLMWDFGDKILALVNAINNKNFEIDNLYEHLIRDLGRKKGWLKKIIIFRRNLPERQLIPPDLNWATCKDAPKKSAELILNGKIPKPQSKKK